MSRDLNSELMIEFFEFDEFWTDAIESAIRILNKICEEAIWTTICLLISLFVSVIIASRRKTEWASARLTEWLCLELTIFRNQSASSSSRLTISENEHSTNRLLSWRRTCSLELFVLRSRSQINHAFLMTSSFDFLNRSITTAYLWESACWLTLRMRSCRNSKLWSFSGETSDMIETGEDERDEWVRMQNEINLADCIILSVCLCVWDRLPRSG